MRVVSAVGAKGAAGSATFPPPDHSGASPSRGPSPVSPRLGAGSTSRSRRWHPGCRRCLLKGCETLVPPRRPQARYCSPACQAAARRWRRWRRSTLTGPLATAEPPPRPGPTLSRPRSASDRLSRRAPIYSHLPGRAERTSPAEPGSHHRSTPGHLRPRRGPAPRRNPRKNRGRPCHRPGCYVLFLPAPRSPDRRFCSSSCRRALRRVRQREARLRRRRRRGIPPRRAPIADRHDPISLMSSRIEQAGPLSSIVPLAPQDRGGSGRAGPSGPPFPRSASPAGSEVPMAPSHPTALFGHRPVERLGLAYRRYRLPDPEAEAAMVGSLAATASSPHLVVCPREEAYEVLDGFSAWPPPAPWAGRPSACGSGRPTRRAAKAAIYGLNQTGRRTQEWEDAWIVHALVRDDGLTRSRSPSCWAGTRAGSAAGWPWSRSWPTPPGMTSASGCSRPPPLGRWCGCRPATSPRSWPPSTATS